MSTPELFKRSRMPACAASCLLLALSAAAQTPYPYIDFVHPLAVRRGESTELNIQTTHSIKSAYLALIEGEGIRAEVLPRTPERSIADNRAIVRIDVAADAALGPREIRLATEEAITTAGRFYVTDLPASLESAKNTSLQEAQPIELPAVVNGRIEKSVEVDWYRFQARKGERVNFTVLGARLQQTIHHIGRFIPHFDPFLTLTDAGGRELASADDDFFADPLLSFEIPADGAYNLAVREANFKGHAFYTYALIAVPGAFTALTFPLVLEAGKETEVELIGPGHPPGARATAALPAGAVPGQDYPVRPRDAKGIELGEVLAAAAALPLVLEDEGAGADRNDRPEAAQEVALPAGIAGRLGRPDDIDLYAFEAVKDARYRFEVIARRLFSRLDARLEVLDAGGRVLGSADDGRDLAGRLSKDPVLEWTAPGSGRFLIRIGDLNQRGGEGFIYHLECRAAEPDFALTCDPDLAMVGPGNRTPIFVRAHPRGGFEGEIALEILGLPEGVRAAAPPILSGMRDACVVLEAAPDAPRGASLFRVRGRSAVKSAGGGEIEIVREAVPLAEIYQAQRVTARTAAIAVTRPSDIALETEVTEVVLRPGETQPIPIKLLRSENYRSGPVTLWGMWRFEGSIFGNSLPPGVTINESASSTSINGAGIDGKLALQAAPDAKPIQNVQSVVIGLVPIEFSVFVPYCTAPIRVTVRSATGAAP